MEGLRTFSVPLSKYSVATCAMFYHLIPEAKLKKGLLPLGPVFRLLSNFEGQRGKQYLPQERCGEDVELAANRMPAYWERMRADESNSLTVAVAFPQPCVGSVGKVSWTINPLASIATNAMGITQNTERDYSGERRRMVLSHFYLGSRGIFCSRQLSIRRIQSQDHSL